ncbi:hypothetical protein [uncultured Ruminobacter sp.]|uniref:hypothetical protein n=1 Tax=uncultured Ruminobacter sp. TaxID=538947 RepID=UPI0025E1949E|nr:hypothetical protein [uncultured Ruminobacter sp.]
MHIKQISSYPELHIERNHASDDLLQEFNFLIADRDKALGYEAKNGEMLLPFSAGLLERAVRETGYSGSWAIWLVR